MEGCAVSDPGPRVQLYCLLYLFCVRVGVHCLFFFCIYKLMELNIVGSSRRHFCVCWIGGSFTGANYAYLFSV